MKTHTNTHTKGTFKYTQNTHKNAKKIKIDKHTKNRLKNTQNIHQNKQKNTQENTHLQETKKSH